MPVISRVKKFFTTYQLPILSGFLIGTSFIPFPPWAILFGFVPLWIFWLRNQNFKQVLIGGWVCQFLLTLIGFNWVSYTIHEFAFLPWSVSIVGLLIFCSFANWYIPLAGGLWLFLQKKLKLPEKQSLFALALIVAIIESIDLTIFKWNFGFTWYWSHFPIYQIAEYTGFQGISSIMILLNTLVVLFWVTEKNPLKISYLAILAGIFCSLNLLGFIVEKNIETPNAVTRPLIVQANISNQQKVHAEQGLGFRDYIINKYSDLTKEAWEKEKQYPDFAIWPETAFPDYLNDGYFYSGNALLLRKFLSDNKIRLITGAYAQSPYSQRASNGMYFINEDGLENNKAYFKNILLSFGETVPGSETFPFLKELFPMVADFKRGDGPEVIDFHGLKVAPQICYESLFPHFSRDISNLGAEVIINITNDSWYGPWQEPYQHMYMTLARAIEFRRPVIRSTNTGISTVALASGKVLKKSPINEEWAHTFLVPYIKNPKPTFYQRFYWIIPSLLIISLLLIVGFHLRKEYKS